MMTNACTIGNGYVGRATCLTFNIDKYYTRHESTISLEEAAKCRYIFISLPTPTIDGEAFTKDIEKIIKLIDKMPNPSDRVFIIRSTVPPGFAKSLGIENVVSNPEFLSEATWEQDAVKPQLVVIGSDSPKYREVVTGLYRGRFKYSKPLETDNTTAELIKYALNSFFATKVVFGNEIFDYANKVGANYETIKRALEGHPWGSKNHFTPVYKGKRGIHGSCLPKDLEALSNLTGSFLFKVVSERGKSYV